MHSYVLISCAVLETMFKHKVDFRVKLIPKYDISFLVVIIFSLNKIIVIITQLTGAFDPIEVKIKIRSYFFFAIMILSYKNKNKITTYHKQSREIRNTPYTSFKTYEESVFNGIVS